MPMLGHTGGSAGKPLTVSHCRGAMQRRWTLVESYRNTVRVARHDRRGQFTGRMVNPHYYSPPYTYYSRGGRTALRWTTIGESRRRAPQLEPALTLAQTLSDHLGRSANSKKHLRARLVRNIHLEIECTNRSLHSPNAKFQFAITRPGRNIPKS
jgi:hypothetical protein